MSAQPYTPDKYSEAIALFERRATETAIAAAPILGLLPSAIITAIHCDLYLHFGPIFSPLTGAGVEAVSIAIVATRVLLPGKGLTHREKDMDKAFFGYVFALATINLGLNVFNLPLAPASFGQGLAELALGFLAIPVAWLVATRHEIATKEAAIERDEAKDAVLRAEKTEKEAKLRADVAAENERVRQHELDVLKLQSEEKENALKLQLEADATEKDKKRAERLQKVVETSKKVSNSVSIPAITYPKDIRKLSPEQKFILSKMTAKEISIAAKVTVKCGENWLKAFAKEGL